MFSAPLDFSFFIALPIFSNVFKRAIFKFCVSHGNNMSEFRKTRCDCISIINKIWTSVSRFNYIKLISEWKLLSLLLPFGYYFNHSFQQRIFAISTSMVDALREYFVNYSSYVQTSRADDTGVPSNLQSNIKERSTFLYSLAAVII